MDKRKLMLLLMISVLLIMPVVVRSVSAQDEGILGSIMAIFDGDNLPELYAKYAPVIDGILLLILFLGITRFAFKDRFGEQTNMISIALAIILALGAVVFFHFGTKTMNLEGVTWMAYGPNGQVGLLYLFGPIAMVILIIIIGYALFTFINGLLGGENIPAAIAWAYLIVHSLLFGIFKSFFASATKTGSMHMVLNFLRIAYAISIIIIIYSGFKWISGMFSGGGGGGFNLGQAMSNVAGGIKDISKGGADIGGAIGDEVRERREAARERRLEQINLELEDRMGQFETKIAGLEKENEQLLTIIKEELSKLIQFLEQKR